MITLWAILQKKDGYSKRIVIESFKPEYVEVGYNNPNIGKYSADIEDLKDITYRKIYFRFKNFVDAYTAVYEEIN